MDINTVIPMNPHYVYLGGKIKQYYIMFVWLVPVFSFIAISIDLLVKKHNKTFVNDDKSIGWFLILS